MMTRDECIQKYRHELWGIMLHLSRTGMTGAQRSLLEEQMMKKIDLCLSSIWKDCQNGVEVNGKEPTK
jgi:hypothetical protein